MIVLIRAIVAFSKTRNASDDEVQRMQTVDRKVAISLGIAFMVGTTLITVLR